MAAEFRRRTALRSSGPARDAGRRPARAASSRQCLVAPSAARCRRAEMRRRRPVAGCSAEMARLADPGRVKDDARPQKQQPRRSRRRRRGLQPLASEPSTTVNMQPATSATVAVSSREPPSTTKTSLISPAVAPGTSAARVRTKRPFGIASRDDDAQHSLPIASARRWHELTVLSQV